MKTYVQGSKLNDIATIAAAIVAAGLMSLSTLSTAVAGTSTDSNRAPAPRAASTTTTGVSPHINAINQNKMWRGNKTEESCSGIHCRDRGDDHHHQH